MNVEEEVERLKEEIKRLGKVQDDGSYKVNSHTLYKSALINKSIPSFSCSFSFSFSQFWYVILLYCSYALMITVIYLDLKLVGQCQWWICVLIWYTFGLVVELLHSFTHSPFSMGIWCLFYIFKLNFNILWNVYWFCVFVFFFFIFQVCDLITVWWV